MKSKEVLLEQFALSVFETKYKTTTSYFTHKYGHGKEIVVKVYEVVSPETTITAKRFLQILDKVHYEAEDVNEEKELLLKYLFGEDNED